MNVKKFVSIPEWAPVYTDLPHHFNGSTGISILCRAPKGIIEKLMTEPLKPISDQFILRWQHMDDCEGYKDILFSEILFPCKWREKVDSIVDYGEVVETIST